MSVEVRCDQGHEVCEGGGLHLVRRDPKGCAQRQDGSWITRDVCPGPHPEPPQPPVTRAWLDTEAARAKSGLVNA